ncbi:MAG: thiamine diphosphokinase [Lachnospiraceae bacterium]|nr:thiamine diphosphokinase [Lachnospiraceae bacterium]
MRRCVIVGGADINNYEYLKNIIMEDDYVIYCDSGLRHMDKLGLKPSLIVGDFDSHVNPHLDVETIVLPVVKDDTDTVYAAKEGVKRGFEEFLLIGVIGGRLDHSLANVSILLYLRNEGLEGVIVDDYSIMKIVGQKTEYIPDKYSYFSLVNITGKAEGITIKNAKYEIQNAVITTDYQYGVSNEITPGKVAEVSVSDGELLLVMVR